MLRNIEAQVVASSNSFETIFLDWIFNWSEIIFYGVVGFEWFFVCFFVFSFLIF